MELFSHFKMAIGARKLYHSPCWLFSNKCTPIAFQCHPIDDYNYY